MKLATLALVAVAPAVAAQVPSRETLRRAPPIMPAPPPVVVAHAPAAAPATTLQLLRWIPGPVRCGAAAYPAAAVRRPWSGMAWAGNRPAAVTLRFRLDPDGRPLGIAREGSGFVAGGNDLAPSLASTRFPAASEERGRCTVTYTPEPVRFQDAPLDELASYAVNPTAGTLPRVGWDRLYATGDCARAPRPQPLLVAYPEADKVTAQPGARDWVMLGYDLDARGRTTNIRVLTGTQNATLEQRGIAAVRQARFTKGPRTGCRVPFSKAPPALRATPAPEEEAFRPPASNCPREREWTRKPALVFPAAWNRRSIEGWAMIGFDVAPWGATGNVRVLAAEPAVEFGESAANIIRAASVAAPGSGMVGCVERVLFRIAADADPAEEVPPPVD